LPAHRREYGVGLLNGDDLFDKFGRNGLDVRGIGKFRVCHDRCGIAVDKNNAIPFLPKDTARLRAGVIKLARLANDDGTGTDDKNGVNICSLGHFFLRYLRRQSLII
jgi:hypothetical protein